MNPEARRPACSQLGLVLTFIGPWFCCVLSTIGLELLQEWVLGFWLVVCDLRCDLLLVARTPSQIPTMLMAMSACALAASSFRFGRTGQNTPQIYNCKKSEAPTIGPPTPLTEKT